jgi:hypothetical protein
VIVDHDLELASPGNRTRVASVDLVARTPSGWLAKHDRQRKLPQRGEDLRAQLKAGDGVALRFE